LVAAIVSLAEGAALVRFINTVPTRFNEQSQSGDRAATLTATAAAAVPLTNDIGSIQGRSDRVGLQYFSQMSGTVAAPTIVWTTIFNQAEITGTGLQIPTSPYAWFYAMPALRGYHSLRLSGTPQTAEAAAIDKPFGARILTDNNQQLPSQYDNYEQSRLRADGVGLYLSFAAGTYRMQAYAAISGADDATRYSATARAFQDSSAELTFADNKVYTLVAYGAGKFGESVPLTGNTVRLTMFEESTAPVTFGMASVRFFNGFSAAGVSVDVYTGTGVSDSGRIASGIAVGGLSAYIDVAPGIQKEFPVAQTGSTSNYLASSTAVQRDVRAGSRTTIICAVNNEQSGAGFCRGIPSRVVAYVRLINDLTSQDSLVQGAFGAQKLSLTRINLWASYEVPRPEIVVEGSQVAGTQKTTGHPLTQEGLYPVVVNVAPGTITGYSEVYVPVFIMDFAVRKLISASTSAAIAANDLTYAAAGTNFIYAPIYKRVHFVLKTDGGATLSGRFGTDLLNQEWPFVGDQQSGKATVGSTATTNQNSNTALTLDEYVEAGEYYSVFATASGLTDKTVYAYPRSDILRVQYRRDRTIDTISSGIPSGKGSLNLIAFGSQDWTTTTFSLQQGATSNSPTMLTAGARTTVVAGLTPMDWTAVGPNEIQLNVGTYTYSAATGIDCYKTIPTVATNIVVADGGIYDLFVLNAYGCDLNSGGVARLNVVVQQRAAVAAANAPVVSRRRHALA